MNNTEKLEKMYKKKRRELDKIKKIVKENRKNVIKQRLENLLVWLKSQSEITSANKAAYQYAVETGLEKRTVLSDIYRLKTAGKIDCGNLKNITITEGKNGH